jgi:hypothetical protein
MTKEKIVAVLSEHSESYWNHKSGKAHCDGCDMELCDLTEDMDQQDGRLRDHQADMLIEAGLGLTRPAEAEAWEKGMADAKLQALGIRPLVRNPYLED